MIKKICICDRCKKEVTDSIFEVDILGKTLNPILGLESGDVLANNIMRAFGNKTQLCTECKNELKDFINGTQHNKETENDENNDSI